MTTMTLKGILNDVKNWFDWTPVSVSEPKEVYYNYKDLGSVFLGYEVKVTYKHHGVVEYLFSDDEDKLGIVTRKMAYQRALRFCQKKEKKIKQR